MLTLEMKALKQQQQSGAGVSLGYKLGGNVWQSMQTLNQLPFLALPEHTPIFSSENPNVGKYKSLPFHLHLWKE